MSQSMSITRDDLLQAVKRYEENQANPYHVEYQSLMKQLLLRAITGVRQGEFLMTKNIHFDGEIWEPKCVEYIFTRLKNEGFNASITRDGLIHVEY